MLKSALLMIFAAPGLVGATAVEGQGQIDVTLTCERKANKGRVICEVEIETSNGRLSWADVIVTDAPAFARPLRSRIALSDAVSRTDRRVRIPVAFVATALGRGRVEVRGRAVVCEGGGGGSQACGPASKLASAELVVGTDVER